MKQLYEKKISFIETETRGVFSLRRIILIPLGSSPIFLASLSTIDVSLARSISSISIRRLTPVSFPIFEEDLDTRGQTPKYFLRRNAQNDQGQPGLGTGVLYGFVVM